MPYDLLWPHWNAFAHLTEIRNPNMRKWTNWQNIEFIISNWQFAFQSFQYANAYHVVLCCSISINVFLLHLGEPLCCSDNKFMRKMEGNKLPQNAKNSTKNASHRSNLTAHVRIQCILLCICELHFILHVRADPAPHHFHIIMCEYRMSGKVRLMTQQKLLTKSNCGENGWLCGFAFDFDHYHFSFCFFLYGNRLFLR